MLDLKTGGDAMAAWRTERIHLRLLSPEDVTEAYVAWLMNPVVNRYLENRWSAQTLESVKSYVAAMNASSHDYMFGIFLNDTGEHIGNIKVGGVNWIHRYGDVGLLIGEPKAWGQGYGTEAIALATAFAFRELSLNKLIAGIYANNPGSYKAFMKAGYREVGRMEKHRLSQGELVDEILVEKLRDA